MLAKDSFIKLWNNWSELFLTLGVIIVFTSAFILFLKKVIGFIFIKIDQKFKDLNLKETEKFKIQYHLFHSIVGLYIIFCLNTFNIEAILPQSLSNLINIATLIYISIFGSALLLSTINVATEYNKEYFHNKHFPIHLPIQIIRIFIISSVTIIVIARIAHISPLSILTSLGAATAFLTFIFKDAISGLIASLQLIFQDKVQIGDWIDIPQNNIKGIVEKITITEIRIRVGNGSVVTVPPQNLLTTNITNWRGIKKNKPRSINRIIYIDISSVAFITFDTIHQIICTSMMIDELEKNYDLENPTAKITNLEVFKYYANVYIKEYLAKYNQTDNFQVFESEKNMLGIVSLEIRIILKNIEWNKYNKMDSQIFSHLIAVLPEFYLKISAK